MSDEDKTFSGPLVALKFRVENLMTSPCTHSVSWNTKSDRARRGARRMLLQK